MHNINHIHVDEEAVETALAISSLWSGKDLPNPYKDHSIHQGPVEEEETPIIIEHDSDSEDKEEQAKTHTSPLCLILKHLIVIKPRLMKPMIIY